MPSTIVIAATDPNIIYLLKRYAEASGFETVCCSDAKALPDLISQIQPALIILEMETAETAWQASLHTLKSRKNTRNIPVVAYSCYENVACNLQDTASLDDAVSDDSSSDDGLSNHIAGFLQKSVLYHDFVATLEKAGIFPIHQGN